MVPSNNNRTVLITGASAGIGRAFAEVWAEAGFNLFLTARREGRLQEIAHQLQSEQDIQIDILPMDLINPDAPKMIHQHCLDNNIHIDALVNNAGYGDVGEFEKINWDSHQDFLQVMVNAVVHLTYLFLPGMIKKKYGRIINIASMAPFMPLSKKAGLYSPAKIFQIKFSESIQIQYFDKGIYCSAVCPGLTRSEMHEVPNNAPNWLWMNSRTVAQQGFDAVMKGKTLIINGTLNKIFVFLAKFIPEKTTMFLWDLMEYLSKIVLKIHPF